MNSNKKKIGLAI